jgi:phage terminase small subunit
MAELTPKQKIFVAEYLANGMNATQAAISAGYSKSTACEMGAENLRKPHIATAIGAKAEKHLNKLDYGIDRCLNEVARLAFFDPAKLFEDDGSLKPIKSIDPDTRAVIAGLEVSDIWDSSEGDQKSIIGTLKKVKISDRKGALDMLFRYHALYKDKVEHTGPEGGPIQAQITVKFVKSGNDAG